MTKMKLSPLSGRVLSEITLGADDSAAVVAARLGIAQHTVYYWHRRLVEEGILVKRPLINYSSLGLHEYCVYYSLAFGAKLSKERLRAFLVRSERLGIVFELGGDYQYGMVVLARNVTEVVQVLDAIGQLKGIELTEKHLAVRVATTLFPRKYLGSDGGKARGITMSSGEMAAHLTADERAVLDVCERRADLSRRQMAQELGVSASTFQSRFNALVKKGVLSGFVYGVRTELLGILTFRILVTVRGYGAEQREDFYRFASRQPNVVAFMVYMGSWDFEFFVEVRDTSELVSVREALQEELSPHLFTVKVLPFLGYLKLTPRTSLIRDLPRPLGG